jgi:ABC-type ATPase with predicted acetyltransferase domain
MTLGEILALHNSVLQSRQEVAQSYHHVAIEVPEGRPQIRYHAGTPQWVSRGDVLRCLIADDADGEMVVHIDDRELSAREFCRMLRTFAGWGMRIVFVVPEDETSSEPTIEVREPDDRADAEPVP